MVEIEQLLFVFCLFDFVVLLKPCNVLFKGSLALLQCLSTVSQLFDFGVVLLLHLLGKFKLLLKRYDFGVDLYVLLLQLLVVVLKYLELLVLLLEQGLELFLPLLYLGRLHQVHLLLPLDSATPDG